ncbi:hypothetical protein BZA05DRAFT_36514 [Tricharina praecox]|uniref:uncharacterized protein n=1 Tax=Tricharina praecox TaxID=43433 RepID=UPI00221FFBF6|nr:uncharacterized protein BZA05DRAFT_36514 [Tricharina praecox]KAI5852139.1 hypothetical protein BZA05DRAFT_36514 [Tricharina praecox]
MPTSAESKTFFKIRDYTWENNAEFQAGLRSIVSSAAANDVRVLTNRAKCFYFAKKTGVHVSDAEYQAWLDGGMTSPPTTPDEHEDEHEHGHGHEEVEQEAGGEKDEAPYPKSFAEVVELITAGKPIPGIMEIPDTILPLPTEAEAATAPVRRKPWEKE